MAVYKVGEPIAGGNLTIEAVTPIAADGSNTYTKTRFSTEIEKVRYQMGKNGYGFVTEQDVVPDDKRPGRPWQTRQGIFSTPASSGDFTFTHKGVSYASYATSLFDYSGGAKWTALCDIKKTVKDSTGAVTYRGIDPGTIMDFSFRIRAPAFDLDGDPIATLPWFNVAVQTESTAIGLHNMVINLTGRYESWQPDTDEFNPTKHGDPLLRGRRTIVSNAEGTPWLGLGHGSSYMRQVTVRPLGAAGAARTAQDYEVCLTVFVGFSESDVTFGIGPVAFADGALPVAVPLDVVGQGIWRWNGALTGGYDVSRIWTASSDALLNVSGFVTDAKLQATADLLEGNIVSQRASLDLAAADIKAIDGQLVLWLDRLTGYKGPYVSGIPIDPKTIPADSVVVIGTDSTSGEKHFFVKTSDTAVWRYFSEIIDAAERKIARKQITDFIKTLPADARGGSSDADLKKITDKIDATQKEIDDLELKVAEDEKKLSALQVGKGLDSDLKAGVSSTILDWSADELARGIDARAREVSEIRTLTPPAPFAVFGTGVEVL